MTTTRRVKREKSFFRNTRALSLKRPRITTNVLSLSFFSLLCSQNKRVKLRVKRVTRERNHPLFPHSTTFLEEEEEEEENARVLIHKLYEYTFYSSKTTTNKSITLSLSNSNAAYATIDPPIRFAHHNREPFLQNASNPDICRNRTLKSPRLRF